MSSWSYQKIVNNEAVDFIRIWQTSESLNEAIDRLRESDVWLNRVHRLGERQSTVYYNRRRKFDKTFTTRNLVRSFSAWLRNHKGVNLKELQWVCTEEYPFVDLQSLAESYANIEQAENVAVITPSGC